MSRAVTADHILFNECIESFRPNNIQNKNIKGENRSTKSFLLTSFEISQDWDLGICKVDPTKKIELAPAQYGFISIVNNPHFVNDLNPNLYGIALSAVISFISLRNCKSTRNGFYGMDYYWPTIGSVELALHNPILTAGPGCYETKLSKEKEESIFLEVKDFIQLLMAIEYNTYLKLMQCIRMINLSILVKREDFGLAYLLVVSAIEAIAQIAIKRNKVKTKEPLEKEWENLSKENENIRKLYEAYKQSRGKNSYLKDRYIKFILDYAPIQNWEEYVEHPMEDTAKRINKVDPDFPTEHFTEKNWFEKYPNELKDFEINEILGDSYNYRSEFIHRGQQPPHTDPNDIAYRFFQRASILSGGRREDKLLPNYSLLLGIAKNSIINWAKKQM